MDQRISYRPPTQVANPLKNQQKVQQKSGKESFESFLRPAIDQSNKGITISKHAEQRIQQRNLQINEQQWGQLEEKLAEARRKGLNESLVLIENAALIVNAKNNTVITAMDKAEAGAQIFTNINGAIILN